MNKENIMNYKLYVYIFFSMLSAFALSGVNFNKILKENRYWEARILVVLLSLVMGYIVTNFIYEFL